MRHWAKISRTLATVALITTTAVVLDQQAALAADPVPPHSTCTQHTVTVTLSASDPTPYTMAGQLCLEPDALRGGRAVMLMISGLTYDRSYYNNPLTPYSYSWVYSATQHGYSTFNIDRMGVGLSSRPPADKLTVYNQAYVTEQIVRKLRAGAIGGRAFPIVIGVGHSLGAGILQYLAGTVTDKTGVPDYLVFSAWLHQGYLPAVTYLGNSLHPTSSDPVLAPKNYPTGYMTTKPGTRGTNFYHAAGADSAVISFDESAKMPGTLSERQSLGAVRTSNVTSTITVPVALSVGEFDTLQCDAATPGLSCATAAAIKTREAPYYGPKACLTTFSVDNTGHSVTLHYKGLDSFNFVHNWLDDNLINKAHLKDANGCIPA
jgi:pimeloyl-ACP methyl ester carboxylesterase